MAGPFASETEVINLALAKLGHSLIGDINAQTAEGGLIRAMWPIVRDAALRSHPWNFAVTRASLESVATPPVFGWDNAFTLPSNPWCLRVLELQDEGRGTYLDSEWVVEGRQILTNLSSPIYLRYIARITTIEHWDPLFIDAVSEKLASTLAEPLIKSTEARMAFDKSYQAKLSEARSMDGMEGIPPVIEDETLLAVR